MKPTNHSNDRMKERVGLSTKASERLATKALAQGLTHSQTSGPLKSYLDKLYLSHRSANNMRIYGEHVYLFNGNTLITVLHLSNDLKRIAHKLVSRLISSSINKDLP